MIEVLMIGTIPTVYYTVYRKALPHGLLVFKFPGTLIRPYRWRPRHRGSMICRIPVPYGLAVEIQYGIEIWMTRRKNIYF
jgi:hypothetical protein